MARNGTEHTHPEFIGHLRSHSDPASKFVRFAPDGIALPIDAPLFHWEAKCSAYLERDAYETYRQHEIAGCRILLFLRTGLGVFWCWARDIPFVDSELVVAKYRPEQRFPIVDGWICPRLANNRGDLLTGSGTPFRQIDFSRCELVMRLPDWEQATRPDQERPHVDVAPVSTSRS